MKKFVAVLKKLPRLLLRVVGMIIIISYLWDWVFPYSDKEINQAKQSLSRNSNLKGKDLAALERQAQEIADATNIHEIEAIRVFTAIAMNSYGRHLIKNARARGTVAKAAINLGKATDTDQPKAAEYLAGFLKQFKAGPDQAGRFANILIANAQKVRPRTIFHGLKTVGEIKSNSVISFANINAQIQILIKRGIGAGSAGEGIGKVLSELGKGLPDTNPAHVGFSQALKNLKAQKLSNEELKTWFGEEALPTVKVLLRHAHTFDALVKKLRQEADRLEREQKKKN